jgi:hypothetical protein
MKPAPAPFTAFFAVPKEVSPPKYRHFTLDEAVAVDG